MLDAQPFTNISRDPADDWLGGGIAATVAADLSSLGDATLITDFVQQAPLDGAPATEETEVYLAYDTEHIYVGIRAHYSDTTLIRANRSDRDQTFSDDTTTSYL